MTTPKKRSELDTILILIKKGFTKKQIQEKLNINKSNLSNYLRNLEKKGHIRRNGKFLIEVLNSQLPSSLKHPRVHTKPVNLNYNRRGHAFNIKVVFPNEVMGLKNKEVINQFKKRKLEQLSFGSYKLIHKNNTIWINNNSLTIYSNNSYYSNNALHSKFQALKDLDILINYLKNRFNYKGIYGIEVFREHYGLIFNKFAKWTLSKNRKLYVKNFKDKTTLWVDDSLKDDINLKEFESNSPLKIELANKYFESLDKTNFSVTPELTLNLINKLTQNQLEMQNTLKMVIDNQNIGKMSCNGLKNELDTNLRGYIA